jgi:hypothetical protein
MPWLISTNTRASRDRGLCPFVSWSARDAHAQRRLPTQPGKVPRYLRDRHGSGRDQGTTSRRKFGGSERYVSRTARIKQT